MTVVHRPNARIKTRTHILPFFLLIWLAVALLASALTVAPLVDAEEGGVSPSAAAAATSIDSLVIGVGGEDIGAAVDTGAVTVLYPTDDGLTASGNQFWRQGAGGILGQAEADDTFGLALTSGDFDGDGLGDLAVGVPGEDIGAADDAGAVSVLYRFPQGLGSAGNQIWQQGAGGILGEPQPDELFAYALTSGDFNGDGYGDLAVGVPFEVSGPVARAGAVNVLYGAAGGLGSAGNQVWRQGEGGILGQAEALDTFGLVLTSGDFNGDGFGDLAVGARADDIGPLAGAGVVNVLYGSADGLSSTDNQIWHQDTPAIVDQAEAGDNFGAALTSGDFNGDGFGDLAVGVRGEDIGAADDAGAVNVLYGSADGLSSTGNQIWQQGAGGIVGEAEADDSFGLALTSGDFNGDGYGDLAVGVPFEDIGPVADAGVANVLYGSASGLGSAGNQVWQQGASGILGQAEEGDVFGAALTSGDFNGDGFGDLAVGAPYEGIGPVADAGVANVLYGSASGLGSAGNQIWQQDTPVIVDQAEVGDFFGGALAAIDGPRAVVFLPFLVGE